MKFRGYATQAYSKSETIRKFHYEKIENYKVSYKITLSFKFSNELKTHFFLLSLATKV